MTASLKCLRFHTRGRIRAAVEAMEQRVLLSAITVNTLVDRSDPATSHTVSLRDAIALAAKQPGADVINLPAGDYKLGLGELRVSDTSGDLKINAPAGATIDAQGKSTAVYVAAGDVTLVRLTITGGHETQQSIGSGVVNIGKLVLNQCTITGNDFGVFNGVFNTDGHLDVINSSVCGNLNDGIDNAGTLSIVNSTVSGNKGFGIGDLGYSDGAVSIHDSTITRNTKGGLTGGKFGGPFPICANSIIAQNGGVDAPDVTGPITSLGHNLIGIVRGSTGWTTTDQFGNDAVPIDPRLSPLGHYQGIAPSMVPMAGSPALGAGDVKLVPEGVVTDQRGLSRQSGGILDIGAVQTQPPAKIQISPPLAQRFSAGQVGTVSLGTFSAAPNAGQFVLTVAWGDGSPDSVLTLPSAGSRLAIRHRFNFGGTISPHLAMTDRFGDLSNLATFDINVAVDPLVSFVVNTAKDQTDPLGSGVVSLRDAVDRANRAKGPVSILFDPTVFNKPTTIALNSAQLEFRNTFGLISVACPTSPLSIDGVGARIFLVDRGVSLSLTGLTMTDGQGSDYSRDVGGAIENFGTLTIRNCVVTNSYDYNGGGIGNRGTLDIFDSQFANNSAHTNGGAIDNSGELVIQRSTLSGNISAGAGGLYNTGDATVSDCTFNSNLAYFSPYENYYVTGSGGAIANSGRLTVTNSTFSGNTAKSDGGAIQNSMIAQVVNCTITENKGYGGGIRNEDGAFLALVNSIVAANVPVFGYFGGDKLTASAADVAGTIVSQGHNLIGSPTAAPAGSQAIWLAQVPTRSTLVCRHWTITAGRSKRSSRCLAAQRLAPARSADFPSARRPTNAALPALPGASLTLVRCNCSAPASSPSFHLLSNRLLRAWRPSCS